MAFRNMPFGASFANIDQDPAALEAVLAPPPEDKPKYAFDRWEKKETVLKLTKPCPINTYGVVFSLRKQLLVKRKMQRRNEKSA